MGKDKKNKNREPKFAIVVSKFNEEITSGLLKGAMKVFDEQDFSDKNIKVVHCPGAFEIPLVAKTLIESKRYDSVICLGAVIRGETAHFEFISSAVTSGIARLNLDYNIPVTFGVLTCFTDEQAMKRSSDDENNKGSEAALAAIETLKLIKEI